jgi:hypothetical protein
VTQRIWTAVAFSIVLQVIAPASADAWWEFIEGLSGPKLHGPHFEGRVVCFMKQRSHDEKDLLERYRPKDQTLSDRSLFPGLTLPCLVKVPDVEGYRRQFSIDAGFRYHWDGSFGPANGHRVNFMSLGAVFTWYTASRPTRDVLDLSAGGGRYWFFSCAFPSFSGNFLDVHADLHVPTVIRRMSKWTVFIPTGRAGVLGFLDGFKENAFADTANGFTSKAMPGGRLNIERGAYLGFFFDLDALLLDDAARPPRPKG